MAEATLVLYWDASAVLSLLFEDAHSATALSWWHKEGTVHILSSLAHIETAAVIARLERTRALDASLTETAYANLAALG